MAEFATLMKLRTKKTKVDDTIRPLDGVRKEQNKPKDSEGQPAHCKP